MKSWTLKKLKVITSNLKIIVKLIKIYCVLRADQTSVTRYTHKPRTKNQNLKLKIMFTHYILAKLTKICWKWLSTIASYFMQFGVTRYMRGPTSKTKYRIKNSRSHLIILMKLTRICWRWLEITASYLVRLLWLHLHLSLTS
jgi:hypothetical protein